LGSIGRGGQYSGESLNTGTRTARGGEGGGGAEGTEVEVLSEDRRGKEGGVGGPPKGKSGCSPLVGVLREGKEKGEVPQWGNLPSEGRMR